MENELIELLKEVLALHGIKQGDYPNGLLERGVLYRELGDNRIYTNNIDQDKMVTLDNKIIETLNKFKGG
jgi:hypothetical protein